MHSSPSSVGGCIVVHLALYFMASGWNYCTFWLFYMQITTANANFFCLCLIIAWKGEGGCILPQIYYHKPAFEEMQLDSVGLESRKATELISSALILIFGVLSTVSQWLYMVKCPWIMIIYWGKRSLSFLVLVPTWDLSVLTYKSLLS